MLGCNKTSLSYSYWTKTTIWSLSHTRGILVKKFSDQFPTFFDWKKRARNSSYAQRITKLHYRNPNATLSQLSGKNKLAKKTPLHLIDPRGLSAKERDQRNNALFVLNKIRRREDPLSVLSSTPITVKTLQKHLGDNITIKGDSIKVTKRDKIPREMIISSNGIEMPIIVTTSKDASKIARYQNAKRHYLQTGDDSELKKFAKIKIKDIEGKTHRLETNPNKIIAIEERREDFEQFEIYKS